MAKLRATCDCFVDSYYNAGEIVDASGDEAKKLLASTYFEKVAGAEPKQEAQDQVSGRPHKKVEVK